MTRAPAPSPPGRAGSWGPGTASCFPTWHHFSTKCPQYPLRPCPLWGAPPPRSQVHSPGVQGSQGRVGASELHPQARASCGGAPPTAPPQTGPSTDRPSASPGDSADGPPHPTSLLRPRNPRAVGPPKSSGWEAGGRRSGPCQLDLLGLPASSTRLASQLAGCQGPCPPVPPGLAEGTGGSCCLPGLQAGHPARAPAS